MSFSGFPSYLISVKFASMVGLLIGLKGWLSKPLSYHSHLAMIAFRPIAMFLIDCSVLTFNGEAIGGRTIFSILHTIGILYIKLKLLLREKWLWHLYKTKISFWPLLAVKRIKHCKNVVVNISFLSYCR